MNYCNLNKFASLFSVRKLIECRSATTKTVITADGKDVPKRKTFENRITLIGTDNSVSITDYKNAQSLSTRRELKLVKIQDVDSKTRRPVYKLMSNAEYHEEELTKRKEKQASRQNLAVKGEKLVTLSSRIGEHDLMTGIKKMLKLVEKQYEVRVVITGEDANSSQKLESIFSVIEKQVKSVSKVLQKRVKGNSLRFQLMASRDSSSEGSDQSSKLSGNEKGPL